MGRAPCCDKANVKKGPWSVEEDEKLKEFINKYGPVGNWIALPQKAGLKRCGKSCRLRWLNYLRPNIKHGQFSHEEDTIICSLYQTIGSRWSIIASQLPGRTDNDIKNYWNTKLKKKLMAFTQPPFSFPLHTSTPQSHSLSNLSHLHTSFSDSNFIAQQSNHLVNYPMKDNMLVYGPDRSCGGKVLKNEEIGFCQGLVEEPLGSVLGHHHKHQNGVFDSQLQYDLEEVSSSLPGAALERWGCTTFD